MPISSAFSPASPQAQAINNLFTLDLALGAVIFLIVTGLVIFMITRFRGRPGEGEPSQAIRGKRIEIVWTGIPLLILVVLFFFTMSTMAAAGSPTSHQQPDLIVIGHQWWWEFQYPKLGITTANEAHIPAGQPMLVELQSADVIHDFWVPNLGRKIDLQPDFPTWLTLQPTRPGTYLGACSEYCGTEHAWMRLRVIADPPDQFTAWINGQKAVPPTPTGGDAARGAQLFQQDTCIACHTIAGTQAKARFAPDLTHIGSRQTIGAGVLDNTPQNMARWLKNPQAVKPGSFMPNFQLSDADVNALTAYLEGLK